MLVYATTGDLASWVDPIPVNAAALLRSASLRVREATKTAFYAVDGTGLPTSATVLQAFKDATCAHAAALSTAGINPSSGGVLSTPGVRVGKKVGSASVEYADATRASAGKASLLTTLCPDGMTILAQAGVIPASPWVAG